MKKTSGFTIVELLIVIVVIGILAAITIVAYNSIQDRARAAAMVTGIKSIDKAFRALAAENGDSTWPIDDPLTGVNNPTIGEIIAATNLKNYLQRPPEVSGISMEWTYDNDGDVRSTSACDTVWSGVNITISNVPNGVLQQVDNTMDDGNTSCGRVRLGNAGRVLYALSFDQNL
jgi:prepilin-type N-terminal cleavage/methylation domain-containing protein